VLEKLKPQLMTFICGDFNARVGTLIPTIDTAHPPRFACDTHVCPRAKWLLTMCNLHQYYILNGIYSPAAFTCHTGRGESTVDYFLCNQVQFQVHHIPQAQLKISDHDLLIAHIPIVSPLSSSALVAARATAALTTRETPKTATNMATAVTPNENDTAMETAAATADAAASATPKENITAMETAAATADAAASAPSDHCGYSWRAGDCLANYSNTAKIWQEHTSTPEFATAFQKIVDDQNLSNDERDT
jgi:hypothetical protein